MRQIVDHTEHDILAVVLHLGLCDALDIARFCKEVPEMADYSKTSAILDFWTKDGMLEKNSDGFYCVRPEKKLVLKNELMLYEATIPPQAFSLHEIAPYAAESLLAWKEMALTLESDNVPEKDRELYLKGITVVATGLMQKLNRTLDELVATAESMEKLMNEIDAKMIHLTAPSASDPAKTPAAPSDTEVK